MIVDLNKDYIFRGFVFEIFAEKKLRKIKKNTFIFRTLQFKDLDTILNYYNLNINDIKGKYLLKKYFRCIDLIEFEIPIIKKDEPKIVKNINVYEVKTKIHTRKRGNDISISCYNKYKELEGLGIKGNLIDISIFENWRFSLNIHEFKNYKNFCIRKSRGLFNNKS